MMLDWWRGVLVERREDGSDDGVFEEVPSKMRLLVSTSRLLTNPEGSMAAADGALSAGSQS